MTIRRGFVKGELSIRAPDGFTDEDRYILDQDISRLTTFRSISRRAIAEARWLGQRTDGLTATAPYSKTVNTIADAMFSDAPSDGYIVDDFRELILATQIEETLAEIVEGSLVLPRELADDQIEDWVICQALERNRRNG